MLNFSLFCLDGYKLSHNKYIKILQLLSPLLLLIFLFLSYYRFGFNYTQIFLDDSNKNNNNVSIHGKVEIGKDAATEISKGISSIGSNVGLAGTIGAVTAGVSKVVCKGSLPPVQKASIVLGSSVIGAGIHIGASALNRLNNNKESYATKNLSNFGVDKSNKFMDQGSNSVLSDLILSIDMITSACLSLIIILSIMIFFKFFLNQDKIKFDLTSSFNYYLVKMIKFNKKTSVIYIYTILFVLLVGLGFDCYFINVLYSNIDKLVDLHINTRTQ